MDVSIIIVNWNAKMFLLECLKYLEAELAFQPTEIIVVDNCSSDGSQEAVGKMFPNVRLVRNKINLGFSKANNIGIRESKGRYVCLVNSDIKVLPGCLSSLYKYMEKNVHIGIVGPRILNSDMSVQPSCRRFPNLKDDFFEALGFNVFFPKSNYFGGEFIYLDHKSDTMEVDILSGCFWMIRREVLNEVGFLDENFYIYGEDKDYCRRVWCCGWKVVYFIGGKAIHYGGASSSNDPARFFLEMQRAQVQLWKKYNSNIRQRQFIIIRCFHLLIRIVYRATLHSLSFRGKRKDKFELRKYILALHHLFTQQL